MSKVMVDICVTTLSGDFVQFKTKFVEFDCRDDAYSAVCEINKQREIELGDVIIHKFAVVL